MSNTLIDERFQANAYGTAAIANSTTLCVIIGTAISIVSILKISSHHVVACILFAALVWCLGYQFLQQYLLYQFENET